MQSKIAFFSRPETMNNQIASFVIIFPMTKNKIIDQPLISLVNFQRDFPSAMDAVNSSSAALNEAVLELRTDPYSSQGRRKLITGAKGILTG